jgi:hypothetical protein
MPGLDGTGPMGQGPMTGGRRGRCATEAAEIPTATGPGMGRGMGYGRGMSCGPGGGRGRGGRGYRNQYYATGLTGWQRAEMAATPAGDTVSDAARLERLEAKLSEALDRLSRLEGTE